MGIMSTLSNALGGTSRRPTIGAGYGGRHAPRARGGSGGAGRALLGTLGTLALRQLSRRGAGGAVRGRSAYGRPSGGLLGGLLGAASRGRSGRRPSGGRF